MYETPLVLKKDFLELKGYFVPTFVRNLFGCSFAFLLLHRWSLFMCPSKHVWSASILHWSVILDLTVAWSDIQNYRPDAAFIFMWFSYSVLCVLWFLLSVQFPIRAVVFIVTA